MVYRAIVARHVAKRGIAQMCLCETNHQMGIAPFWESAAAPYGCYDSECIAISRDKGPLRLSNDQQMGVA